MQKTDTAKENLKKILGSTFRCPMCNNQSFQFVDGYITLPVQTSLSKFQIGGPSIPCVAIICTRCGFLSHHAVGIFDPNSLLSGDKTEEV